MSSGCLKVAVTGLGVSKKFLPRYIEAPETDVVLLHDIDEKKARETAARFGIPRWTTRYDDVLTSDAQIVDVSTPNHLHAEQAIAAFEAGKHVLCQKPMAPSVSDCRRMVEAARRTGKTLGLMMDMHSNPVLQDVKAAIGQGLLGKIAAVRVRCAHRGPFLSNYRATDHWRASRANIGGGSFMQLGVHVLNLALWMLEDDVVSVTGYAKNLYCQQSIEGEDTVAASGELRSGALITMESGYSSVGTGIEIQGTAGHVIWVENDYYLEMSADFDGKMVHYQKPQGKPSTVRLDGAPLEAKIEAIKKDDNPQRGFARAVLAGKPAPVPGEVGTRDVAIIQAIYLAAEQGGRVQVKDVLNA